MSTVAKRIKYSPYKDSVNHLIKEVPLAPLSEMPLGRFVVIKDEVTGEFNTFQIREIVRRETSNTLIRVEQVYDINLGVILDRGVETIHDTLGWLMGPTTQNNIEETRTLLRNFRDNDAAVLLGIKEALDVLGWEYSVGVDCDTADAIIIYREDSAPADAVGKNAVLSLLADPKDLQAAFKYLTQKAREAVEQRRAARAHVSFN